MAQKYRILSADGHLAVDCDADAILLKVEQVGGAACHHGYESCFFREVTPSGIRIDAERVFDPDEVYKKNDT